jgi:predicted amidohydrolase
VIDSLFQSSDPIQIFLNAYSQCRTNRDRAYNLLRGKNHNDRYNSTLRQLRERLRAGAPVSSLRNAFDSVDPNDMLVGALSLSTAVADHIAKEYGSQLSKYSEPFRNSAGDRYWLALEGKGPLGGRIPNPPRSDDEMHGTLRRFRRPLLVTPHQFGEWQLTRIAVDGELETYFHQRLRDGRFRIAVSSLSFHARIKGEPEEVPGEEPPCEFHLTSIEPEEEQLAALRGVLQRAYNEGASMLVLPELRMPPALLAATREFLFSQVADSERGLLLVAAGSWHVMIGDARYNRCFVLNRYGKDLWTHDKLREYRITPENVRQAPQAFLDIGVKDEGGREGIHRGMSLEFYDSVIGRIAAAICIGFFADEVGPLLKESAANLFLVPAMTTSTADLKTRARELIRPQRAATFVANCGHVGAKAFSFYQLPIKRAKPRRLTHKDVLLVFDLSNL